MKSRLRRKVIKQFESETQCKLDHLVDPIDLQRCRVARALKTKLWKALDSAMEYYYSKQF